jgi:hypothetical protein
MGSPTLDYLSINTLIDIKMLSGYKFLPILSMGPRVDYLIIKSEQFDELENYFTDFRDISYGAIFGLGFKFKFSKFQLGLRADYYINFNKIAKWPAGTRTSGGTVTDETFTVNLTFGFKL